MKRKYSIAIYPSQDVINLVKTMKGFLKSKIQWYNSCNSTAHITICEFELDYSELEILKKKLSKICDTFTPFQVYLDHFGAYELAGAFFIGVNENQIIKKPQIKRARKPLIDSNKKAGKPKTQKVEKPIENLVVKSKLKEVMKKTQEALEIANMKKSNDPHISIARRLTPENITKASQLFTAIESEFLCKEMVLREFDPIKKQFFVIDTIPFGSNPQPELIQGSLF